MPNGRHIYANAYDMAKATMCAYPHSDHALPHCKRVLRCFSKFPCVNITDKKTDDQYSDTTTSIFFHIHHLISHFTAHLMIPLNERKFFRKCKNDSA